MKRVLYIVAAAIAIIEIVYHLMTQASAPGRLFGYEVPVIPYLGFWLVALIASIYGLSKLSKGQR